MLASELIKELEQQISSGGDREVVWYNLMEAMFENITHVVSYATYCPDDSIVITDGDYSRD
jgi:hypothetical protein